MSKRTEIRYHPSPEQNEFLLRLSNETGLTKTDVIRSILFHYQTGKQLMKYPRDFAAYSEVAKQINIAGNNLNQSVTLSHTLAKKGRADDTTVAHLQAAIVEFNNTILPLLTELSKK